MEYEEEILFEVANALLLFSSSPPPDLPQAATINLSKPHPLPPAAMHPTSIENILSVSFPSWGFHKRRSNRTGNLKRKQVEGPSPPTAEAATCIHRSPDSPLVLGAASNLYSRGSNGLPCSSEIRPFKRLRSGETSVQEYGAQLKLKRKQVAATCGHRISDKPLDLGAASNPSSSESNGLMCSSEIRPLKRLRTCRTRVPECDAQIKLKRKEGGGPSPSTSALSDGFPYSSEIHGCGFRCNDGLKRLERKDYLSQRRTLGRVHLTP